MNIEEQAAARAELELDLAALRRQGVKAFKGSGIDVEFFPSSPPPEKGEKPEPYCACGHQEFEHMNGGCTLGCDNCDAERTKPT